MPTYEYECAKCGHRFEQFQSIKAKPLTKCPVCPGRVKRLLGTGAGLLFKGSGFYATDYVKRRPGSFQKDGKGTIKGTHVPIPQLARDPSVPLANEEEEQEPQTSTPGGDAKEGA